MPLRDGPHNVIAQLPPLEWRGLTAPPYDVITMSWAHDQAARGVPYVDGEMHDWTGRRSFEFTVRLFFLNTIGEGVLFPDAWEGGGWKDALLDGSSDTLQHPLLGPVLARVAGGKTEIRSSIRSGIIVDCTWIEDLDDPGGPQGLIPPTFDAGTLANAADVGAAAFDVRFPPNKGYTSLLDAWNAIKSGLFSVSLSLGGQLDQLMGIVVTMADAIDDLNDATAIAAHDNLVSFWTALRDTAAKVAATNRPTAKLVLRQDTTLEAFAASVSNSLADCMGLNLHALRLPIVHRGTTLTYYV